MEFIPEQGKNVLADSSTLILVCFFYHIFRCCFVANELKIRNLKVWYCISASAVHWKCRTACRGSFSCINKGGESWVLGHSLYPSMCWQRRVWACSSRRACSPSWRCSFSFTLLLTFLSLLFLKKWNLVLAAYDSSSKSLSLIQQRSPVVKVQ